MPGLTCWSNAKHVADHATHNKRAIVYPTQKTTSTIGVELPVATGKEARSYLEPNSQTMQKTREEGGIRKPAKARRKPKSAIMEPNSNCMQEPIGGLPALADAAANSMLEKRRGVGAGGNVACLPERLSLYMDSINKGAIVFSEQQRTRPKIAICLIDVAP